MKLIDNMPLPILLLLCVLLGLAPFVPEPHLLEKIRMLSQGNLKKPIDIFDLFIMAHLFCCLPLNSFANRNRVIENE